MRKRPGGTGRGSSPRSRNGRAGPRSGDAGAGNGRAVRAAPSNGDGRLEKTPPPPSPLAPEELEFFRRLLLAKRQELVGDVEHMEDEALRRNRMEATGDLSLMPIHMADLGTDNYEREFTIGLMANERATLKEIDEALERIRAGTYGVCVATHKPIAKARLRAKPWAQYCVEYKRELEQRGRR